MQDSQFHPLWLLGMSQTMASRSVRIDGAGLDKVRQRMAELEKSDSSDKRGKKCWTEEYLKDQTFVSLSTVKRFLRGIPVDRDCATSILKVLGFDPIKFIAEHDSNLQNSDRDTQPNIAIDWQRVCQEMLHEQQEEQRFRKRATEMGFEVNVFVPLGLIERKHQQRRSGNVPMKLVHQLEQEVITRIYEHDEFMTNVIGQNPTGKNKHIAIVGEPGAGKTTLLDKIATHIQENNQDLPICIALASLQGKTLKDYILQEWLPEAISLGYPDIDVEMFHETSLQKRLRQGGVWLLLDGVDEMAVGANSCLSLEEIRNQLTDWLGNVRVVLTCRTNVWDARLNNPLTGFDTYKTQEFKPEQVDDFIQQWFAEAKNIQRGKELQKKLQEPQKERIRQLVTNPLCLSLLCQIFSKNKQAELPETKAELYQHFVRYFYEWKPSQTVIDWATQPGLQEELHQALGRLSIAGLDSDTRFRLPLSLIQKEMGDKLFKLAWDLGWLNLVDREAATDESVYAFFHPTFQEYFAALAIDDWHFFLNHVPHNPDEGIYRIFDSQWKEVILVWLGIFQKQVLVDKQRNLIEALVEFNDNSLGFYSFRSYCLAAACIAEFRDCRRADEIVNQVIDWGFGIIENETQERKIFLAPIAKSAQITLIQTDREKVIGTLTKQLPMNQDEGQAAAWILGKIGVGNSDAIKALIKLLTSNYYFTRWQAAKSLKQIGNSNPVAISELENLLNQCENQYIRSLAADCLLEIVPDHPMPIKTLKELAQIRQSNEPSYQPTDLSYWKLPSGSPDDLNTLIELGAKLDLIKKAIGSLDDINVLIGLLGRKLKLERVIKGLNDLKDLIQILNRINSCPNNFIFDIIDAVNFTATNKLQEIAYTKPIVVSKLSQLLYTEQEQNVYQAVIAILNKTAFGNLNAVKSLIHLLKHSTAEVIRYDVTESLKIILPINLFTLVVADLKKYLTDYFYENDSILYRYCYDILWYCAQNMSYQEFYRAWQS